MYELQKEMTIEEKLEILSDAAKYDVACTSSGVDRAGKTGYLGNSCASGICHAFAGDGRCISLLKILMTNHCVYDCKYCKNRKSNDVRRATFTPQEICELTIEFYKRNYIEGLFLSSGVLLNATHTMELMCDTLRLLRTEYKFNGYIHVKVIPGASQELIHSAGLLADRISVNMELPTQDSLRLLAPNKSMQTILRPMGQITDTIALHRLANGKSARMERAKINENLVNSIWGTTTERICQKKDAILLSDTDTDQYNVQSIVQSISSNQNSMQYPAERIDAALKRPFASAGQSTQMIIGASNETDYQLIRTTQQLYQSFDLKRVFYSGYIPLNEDSVLPSLDTPVPLLREHRLYQADWLLRYYGFQSEELLSESRPNFDYRIDPKCDWALHHLDQFPIEINTASQDMLLRVPGIGPTGVQRILQARRYGYVNFEMLKKMRVVLKRAQFFITCQGKMLQRFPFSDLFIMNQIIAIDEKDERKASNKKGISGQMDWFRDFGLAGGNGA